MISLGDGNSFNDVQITSIMMAAFDLAVERITGCHVTQDSILYCHLSGQLSLFILREYIMLLLTKRLAFQIISPTTKPSSVPPRLHRSISGTHCRRMSQHTTSRPSRLSVLQLIKLPLSKITTPWLIQTRRGSKFFARAWSAGKAGWPPKMRQQQTHARTQYLAHH